MLDGRLRLDASVYYYNYKDLQAVVPSPTGSFLVDNVGEVDSWGLESSIQWLINENLDVYASGAWTDSEVTEAQALCGGLDDCEGNSLPGVPDFSWSLVADAHFPASADQWVARAELFGQSDVNGGLQALPESEIDAYAEVALRAGYRSDNGWSAIAYVENLTDEEYHFVAIPGAGILPARFLGTSRPRTAGIRLSWEM